MASSGKNTASKETVMETTVKPICPAPLRAAAMGDSPASRSRKIFSITTMASSTTNPTEMVSAMSDRLSRLYPSRYIPPKVPASASGTVMHAISVGRSRCKNTNITSDTSPMLKSSEYCTS